MTSSPDLELDGSIWLRSGGQTWGGAQRIALLSQIGITGSITAAAKAVGMSYKGAWDAIDTMNNLAGLPLMERAAGGKGGGGTRLTPQAERLISAFNQLQQAHGRFLQHLASQGLTGDLDIMRRLMFKTSARNRLLGIVTDILPGAVNDEIRLNLAGGQALRVTITRESTRELELAPGREVIALIKASAVLIGLPGSGLRLSADNQLPGHIAQIRPGAVNDEIVIDLQGGGTLVCVITRDSQRELGLTEGSEVQALFSAASVILGVTD
ncbi:TOBE domain-containing protein [Bordetella avium]|uniref:TOBE domain-containing protein n=1 Tax=Bordetella avium TaxID=521 RepID=UPI000E0B8C30|nr:TOBE domain-containing protein [Bordetella avium]RIQ12475.1 LysR family transcriptional regulator [Bordetella avium]RIQ37288.1 LysR family transcriptional regulator [Bordetella avium]RIQ40505.1 LysR family transcriptional regulator [Bordetella avium]RIQ42089.1 LysR family transcriptional regulator [Bordetella avium]RIQ47840.1 LysR family transcriptional regulator [Bordetella avium]